MVDIDWDAVEDTIRNRFAEDWMGYSEAEVQDSVAEVKRSVNGDAEWMPKDLQEALIKDLEAGRISEGLTRADIFLEDAGNYLTDDPIGALNLYHHNGTEIS